jgi:threonylcarbamoyladenosine tRNA methylthiotransferase MtaB
MAEYHVENFGCRASRADGEAISAALRQAGLVEAADPATAGVVVLNTCSVTAEAERDARAYLRRIRRSNPQVKTVVTGCYAQRAPRDVAALEGVSVVVGNSHKSKVLEQTLLAAGLSGQGDQSLLSANSLLSRRDGEVRADVSIWHDPLFAHADLAALPFAFGSGQTRPNLKVQDGCGNRCSFCIIPVTRGPSRSVSLESALRAVEEFTASGGTELVLSGINLGRWGRELSPAQRLEDLVAAILERTALPRLRISSVEPMDWSPELIALFRQYGRDGGGSGPRLARHAHLPLQSGSDAVLRAMHRRYRPWHYAAKVEAIRAALPEAAIGADVMIGFPGETEALFRETFDFIDRSPLTYLHVFPFSARPGTPAFQWNAAAGVPGEAVKERKTALQDLISRKNAAFRRQFLGVDLPVVTLAGGGPGGSPAISDNFIKFSVAGLHTANTPLRIFAERLTQEGLAGRSVPAS